MTTPRIEEMVERCIKTVETVEFIHGVPVELPAQPKADLRMAIRHALTETREKYKCPYCHCEKCRSLNNPK